MSRLPVSVRALRRVLALVLALASGVLPAAMPLMAAQGTAGHAGHRHGAPAHGDPARCCDLCIVACAATALAAPPVARPGRVAIGPATAGLLSPLAPAPGAHDIVLPPSLGPPARPI